MKLESDLIAGIDHPVIAVRDMSVANVTYEKLGFTIPPRGSHLEWGTGNWCIMFRGDYLELRGITDPTRYTHHLDEFLKKREGLMGVALSTRDADAACQALIDRGLHPQAVRQLTRNFELPEGAVQPRFALCFLDQGETPGLMSVVVCQHLTPELLRRADWLRHRNGAVGVASITGVVQDFESAVAALRRLFGDELIDCSSEEMTVTFSDGRELRLLKPAAATEKFQEIELPSGEGAGHLFAVTLRVADLATTRRYLESQGISYSSGPEGSIRIAPQSACGVLLEFIQDDRSEVLTRD